MMNRIFLIAMIVLLAAPPASAELVSAVQSSAGCTNYGNQIDVASTVNCRSGSDCTNYGTQVYVLSTIKCPGHTCPNQGVRVAVASDVCGHQATQVCLQDTCAGVPEPMMASATSAAASRDCIPAVDYEPMSGGITVSCDSSGGACGINAQPVCWTIRYVCMNALVVVLNLYGSESSSESSCEGQPGWPPAASTGRAALLLA